MDLVDLLDEGGLQQDEWSLTSPTFGKEGQLEAIGWSGKTGKAKIYILLCRECVKDVELFQGGYFKSLKSNLTKGRIPCGCSESTKWTTSQYQTLCSRKANEFGYAFLGFIGEWLYNNTKVRMLCSIHGEWSSGNINNLLRGRCCPKCRIDNFWKSNRKTDETMIQSFFASGAFHPDTKFWRSDRVNPLGHKLFWNIYCPECNITTDSFCGNLQQGKRPCDCSINTQRDAYINFITDGDNVVSIKFGISVRVTERAKAQHRRSKYTVLPHSVYTFPNVASCKKAERECKQELECGILTKQEMPDGYTETTWVYNLEKIIEIYERNRGILNDRQ
jgi:hypothetical protein